MALVPHGDPEPCPDAHPLSPPADFNYGADEYDAEGNEEPKALPEGSETMPYIDESPTMSPQLSARGQESGDGVSPTPTDGLGTGVGAGGSGLCTGGGGCRGSACPRCLWCCELGELCPISAGRGSSGGAMPVEHAVPFRWQGREGMLCPHRGVPGRFVLEAGSSRGPQLREPLGTGRSGSAGLPAPSSGTRGPVTSRGGDTRCPPHSGQFRCNPYCSQRILGKPFGFPKEEECPESCGLESKGKKKDF